MSIAAASELVVGMVAGMATGMLGMLDEGIRQIRGQVMQGLICFEPIRREILRVISGVIGD